MRCIEFETTIFFCYVPTYLLIFVIYYAEKKLSKIEIGTARKVHKNKDGRCGSFR